MLTGHPIPGGRLGTKDDVRNTLGYTRYLSAAVKKAGAKYFLVPAGEYDQARKRAGKGLTVIPVSTLEQALSALHTIGGDTNALGPPPAGLQK